MTQIECIIWNFKADEILKLKYIVKLFAKAWASGQPLSA